MSLRDVVRKAAGVAVPIATKGFGSVVAIKRYATTRAADNSVTRAVAPLPIVDGVDVPMLLTKNAAKRVQRVWGVGATADVHALCSEGPTPAIEDVVVVTEGAYLGETFRVVETLADDLSATTQLALVANV